MIDISMFVCVYTYKYLVTRTVNFFSFLFETCDWIFVNYIFSKVLE